MMSFDLPVAFPFTLGGHVFHSVNECCEEFLIPRWYVTHMLESTEYPGCRYMNEDERTSYLQTLSITTR